MDPGSSPIRALVVHNLPEVSDDFYSSAIGVIDQGESVGISASADFSILCGFIRQNGKRVDLNSLVAGTTSLYLLSACSINSKGQIVAMVLDPNTGFTHADIWQIQLIESAKSRRRPKTCEAVGLSGVKPQS